MAIYNLDSREKDYAKHIEKKKDLILNHKHLQIQEKVIEELEEINQETKEYLNFYLKNNGNFIFLKNINPKLAILF